MIWYDVSEIKNWEGHYTGIQRVISSLGKSLIKDERSTKPCYFDLSTNTYRRIDFNFNNEAIYDNGKTGLKRYARARARELAKSLKERAPLNLKSSMKRILSLGDALDDAVDFKDGDTLLIAGAFWICPLSKIDEIKNKKGVKVVGIIYDLVPMVAPQFTARVTIDGFVANYTHALELFDYWFAISRNTKLDMVALAENRGYSLEDRVGVIRLGVDKHVFNLDAKPPEDFDLKPGGFALFVSTIEARKNQTLIYLAIKRLSEAEEDHLPVVLVGKHGWLSDDIIYILTKDPSIEKKILWLESVDDRALRWLYEKCAFTIYPSYYEGWGLPVAESLAKGKTCIASNASSVPEVAGSLIEYFSPYSSDELAQLLKKYSDKEYLKKRNTLTKKFLVPSWDECAKQVRDILGAPTNI